jgi:glycosyltransferase involved in cell wall biosynthesis
MKKLKIYIYAISKNEEQFVDRFMDSLSEADGVLVLDTGSTDATVEKLRARGATVFEETISPWRFDEARNRALDLLPEDTDICVSIDLDEVLEPGWRAKLESAWQPETTRARYAYIDQHHPDGSPAVQFTREKMHLRHGYRWVHPVHEVLEYAGEEHETFVPGLVLHHYPDANKSRGQYLDLLALSAKENPEDDRVAFWLGREYGFHNRHDKAIAELRRHLTLPGATWDAERSASMRLIARAYRAKGDATEAFRWLLRALAESPRDREPYLALAEHAYAHSDWQLCFFAARKGLAITEKSGHYLEEAAAWGYALHDFAALACYSLGLKDEALRHAEDAFALAPEDERLRKNRDMIAEEVQA